MEPTQKTIEMVFGFPRRGEVYGTFDVLDSKIDPSTQNWSVTFAEEVPKKYAIEALRTFVGKQAIFAIDNMDFSVEFPTKPVNVETIRDNPPGAVQTRVTGSYTVNGAFQNPMSQEDFDADMDKMTVSNPKKHFRIYPAGELHSKKFRDQLFKFVTRRGESYGWVANGEIYHRKGSLVMPYVKINKHIEGSVVSYHTHPSKDEPSLTSPDDIQWYMDAAYKWGIRHFYTIMKDRLDHFEFIVKGDTGRKRYLKMDEGKFVDDLSNLLDKCEKEYKDRDNLNDYEFCEKVTRAWVKEINNKFSHLVEIKYHPHLRPGAPKLPKGPIPNPGSDTPFPHTSRIKVNDKYLSIALNELKGIDYDWIHYGGDEFSHTMYVYWWLKYHFLPKADNTDRLWLWEKKGLDGDTRDKVRTYLQQEVEDGWTNADCLLMLGLFHDIAKKREKEQKIHHSILGADMFKEEIAPELKLPTNLTERLYLMLQSDVGRKNITEEQFQTIAGDLYPVAKMFHMADRTAHHPYMYTIAARMARREGVLKTGEYGDAYIEMANKHDILELVQYFRNKALQNPPPKVPTTVTYSASYGVAIDPDTAEFLFEEYDPRKVPGNDGKTSGSFMMTYRQGLYLKMVLSDGYVASATLGFKYPGNLNITGVPVRDDFGMSGAREVYERVGQVLEQAYEIEVQYEEGKPLQPETFDIVPASDEDSALQPLTNPRPNGVTIVLAGAHGSGRREIAKELHNMGGFMLCPMHTTEPRKPGRQPNRDAVNHSHNSFNNEVTTGNMRYWTIGADGHKYGYTQEQLQHPKSVMYTTPQMAMKMKESMPNITIVFLDNKDSVKRHTNRLVRRNGVTYNMAKATAKRKHTLRNSRHNFDKVVNVQDNDYKKAAITLINPPVLNNPQFDIEGVDFYATIPQVKYKNLGAVSAEIEVDRNIPKELVGNVKDIFYGLIQDYEKKTDKRVALAIAFAVDEITQEVKNRGGNGVIGFTVETGGSLGLPVVEFNKTIPAVIVVTGDAIKTRTTLKNPRTPGGKKFPDKYLKGLTPLEKMIAEDEIDKGYEYDEDDPKAYKFWKSDIKAKARGMKIGPSKHRLKYYKMYRENIDPDYKPSGKTQKDKFLNRITKETGIKKKYLEEIYNKGLAAWRVGHRPGVQQHQWAAGRVYAFAVAAESSTGKGKPDNKLAIEAGVRKNPPISHYLNDVDRHYIDYVKSKMRRISEVAKDTGGRYMVVYEIPVMEKHSTKVHQVGTTRLLFYSRTGTGSESLGRVFADALLNQYKYKGERLTRYDTIAEGPFLHNIAWKEWGDPRGKDFAPLMWMNMLGYDAGWYVKPSEEKMFNFMTGEPITKPAFPSKKFESKFSSRWGHRSMFYAGIALTELIPNPAAQWGGKTLTKNNINLFMKKHGAIIADRAQKHQDSIYVPPDEARVNPPLYGPLPNPSKQPKASFDWLEKFTAWVELVNMKNKELIEFLESDPWGKEAGINKEKAKEEGISRGRFSASRILIMRKKLGLTGPKDYIKAGPMIIRNYYELAQKKWSEADWNWCRKQVSFNSRARGQSGPYTDSKGRPTRKLTALWVWGHDPWRYARKIEKRKTMPKCPDVPWIGRTEKRMYGTTQYKYPEVKSNPSIGRPKGILYHGSSANNLKILRPHYNETLGREVVFATPNYEYALAMSVPSSNDDLEIGYINGEFTIEEQYEGAFDLLKKAAYIYHVDEVGFREHPEFPPMERIIEVTKPIRKVERITNVYNELKRLGTNLIEYW